jgi:hypothetical protein
MTPNLTSVIIPTHNREHFLPQAVESVLKQTYLSIEIIIIDDGSDSGGAATRKTLKSYLASNPTPRFPIRYFYQENQGVGHAVNTGLSLARGEYIQRLDDDDRLLPEKIERSIQVFKTHPHVGLVATGYYLISEGKRSQSYPPCPCPSPTLLNILMRCVAPQPSVMVRTAVHEKVGQYQNMRAQDYEMWIRVAKRYRIEVINEPLSEVRRHSGNITGRNNLVNLERDTFDFISTHLQSTPLDVLIPNMQSKPHAYALRAAVYLLKDGERIRTTGMARRELEKAFQLLSDDPLLYLWKAVLAIHECRDFPSLAGGNSLPETYRPMARELSVLFDERKSMNATQTDSTSPKIVNLRKELGRIRSELIQETYKRAIESPQSAIA